MPETSFTRGRAVLYRLFQMQNISFRTLGMRRNRNFDLNLSHPLPALSPLSFHTPLFYFAGDLLSFNSAGAAFRKAFRNLG